MNITRSRKSDLSGLVERHCGSGFTQTAIPQLVLSRTGVTTEQTARISFPLLCLIASGRKRVLYRGEAYDFDADSYLVVGTNMPMVGQIVEAPCPAVSLSLDLNDLVALALDMPSTKRKPHGLSLVSVNRLDDDLRDAIVRLLRLLDRPEWIPVMSPLVRREILFLLMQQPGSMLAALASPENRLSQISRAINTIRQRYAQTLHIEELAAIAGMSAPSLHRHFKAITSLSPLQFQKQLRLQEAHRMLSTRQADAASVAFDVGYQSPSQFSREYRRLFGTAPSQSRQGRQRR